MKRNDSSEQPKKEANFLKFDPKKLPKEQLQNFLYLALVRKQALCAGYDDNLWIGGREGVMSVIRDCEEHIQCLVVERRKKGNGYATIPRTDQFKRHSEERKKLGIEMYAGPLAKTRAASIHSEYMMPIIGQPDINFKIKWKLKDDLVLISGEFMGEKRLIAEESLASEKGQVILKILFGQRGFEEFLLEKKNLRQEKVSRLKKENNFDPRKDKYKEPDFEDISKDIASKLSSLQKAIQNIVQEKLHLEGIPGKGEWAYKFNTRNKKVGIGIFVKIEKE